MCTKDKAFEKSSASHGAGFFASCRRERYGFSADCAPMACKNVALGINIRLPTRLWGNTPCRTASSNAVRLSPASLAASRREYTSAELLSSCIAVFLLLSAPWACHNTPWHRSQVKRVRTEKRPEAATTKLSEKKIGTGSVQPGLRKGRCTAQTFACGFGIAWARCLRPATTFGIGN